MLDSHHQHYDTIDINEFTASECGTKLQYPCPCGDLFEISLKKLSEGHRVAQCPTCSLTIFVQYDSLEQAMERVDALRGIVACA
jgi:diphthamide biosynthesis protein 3